jgi:hypothetical protein
MERNLSVERTYSLGQYQNIKLFDSIGELPVEAITNPELVKQIRQLQLVQLELDYRNYIKLAEKLHPVSMDEAVAILEELKVNTIDTIKELFNDKNSE